MGQHTAAYQAWTDGSYDQSDKGGTAYLLMNDNLLVKYEARFFAKATSPFHMEVYALLAAAKQAENMRLEECCFHSDSKLLVETLDPVRKFQPLQSADWRSYSQSQLLQIEMIFKNHPKFCCKFTPREGNARARHLANWAPNEQANIVGFTFPILAESE